MADRWTHDAPSERWQQRATVVRSPSLKMLLQRAVIMRRDLLSSRATARNYVPWPVLPEPSPCAAPWHIGQLPNATRLGKDSLLALLIGLAVFVLIVRIVTGPSAPRDK